MVQITWPADQCARDRLQLGGKEVIASKRELAMFLAQIMHESGGLSKIEEVGRGQNYGYGASGFWGRGYIQLTRELLCCRRAAGPATSAVAAAALVVPTVSLSAARNFTCHPQLPVSGIINLRQGNTVPMLPHRLYCNRQCTPRT